MNTTQAVNTTATKTSRRVTTKLGRPEKPDGERLVQRSIRMTAAQWAAIDQNGLPWLRELVETCA